MNRKTGFTLIELLVVVLIIGILSAIALPQYRIAVEKSRAAEALVLGKTIVDSSQRAFMQNGTWPTSYDELDLTLPSGYTAVDTYASNGKFKLELDGAGRVAGVPSVRIYRLDANGNYVDFYVYWNMESSRRTCNIHAQITNKFNKLGEQICLSYGGKPTNSNGVWEF